MTFDQFDKFSAEIISEVILMRDTKGREYAGDKDRFDNFNRLSASLSLDRKTVWAVYSSKHWDSIISYVRNGREFSSEKIRGRIVDMVTYLILLAGMIEEENGCDSSGHKGSGA